MPNLGLTTNPEPLIEEAAQPGAPLVSGHLLTMAQRHTGLWGKYGGTQRSWVWPSPDTAPMVKMTAIDTDYTFGFDPDDQDYELSLPWLLQEAHSEVEVFIRFASEWGSAFTAFVQSDDLVDSVATVQSSRTEVSLSAGWRIPGRMWLAERRWQGADVRIQLAPTVPANRRVSFRVKASWHVPASDLIHSGAGWERQIKIYSIQMRDMTPFPDPNTVFPSIGL